MAQTTSTNLQKLVIYSVFVRNHTKQGTFNALVDDLVRIKALGVDAIWLMPIHPIGQRARKGSLGSPYANQDYRSVNPEYGTMEDLIGLVDAIHEQDMKCLIDVVYNHTSPDSVLWETHPEWFYIKDDGTPGNHVGDWSDIIDLDYSNRALWDYQIESLVEWARIVDGFRCDVASFVPVEFWKQARAAVEAVRPGCIWLAETVHRSFGAEMRRRGLYCATDTEAFEAFDIEYQYDIEEVFHAYLMGEAPLSHYTDLLNFQESVYPRNYNKLRFLENHDTERIASYKEGGYSLENLTAMLFFQKGATLLYAGQEYAFAHAPSLFDRDTLPWEKLGSETTQDLCELMARLAEIKHEVLGCDDFFFASADDAHEVACMKRISLSTDGLCEKGCYGIFSLKGNCAEVALDVADGSYQNLIDGKDYEVAGGVLVTQGAPLIFEAR